MLCLSHSCMLQILAKRINATLLNILLGVLVLRSKRNKRKTSLNMILCIEDDGVVKSEATGKQILN